MKKVDKKNVFVQYVGNYYIVRLIAGKKTKILLVPDTHPLISVTEDKVRNCFDHIMNGYLHLRCSELGEWFLHECHAYKNGYVQQTVYELIDEEYDEYEASSMWIKFDYFGYLKTIIQITNVSKEMRTKTHFTVEDIMLLKMIAD